MWFSAKCGFQLNAYHVDWRKFLQENGGKDPWEVVRIAKDPFHMKARLHTIVPSITG